MKWWETIMCIAVWFSALAFWGFIAWIVWRVV